MSCSKGFRYFIFKAGRRRSEYRHTCSKFLSSQLGGATRRNCEDGPRHAIFTMRWSHTAGDKEESEDIGSVQIDGTTFSRPPDHARHEHAADFRLSVSLLPRVSMVASRLKLLLLAAVALTSVSAKSPLSPPAILPEKVRAQDDASSSSTAGAVPVMEMALGGGALLFAGAGAIGLGVFAVRRKRRRNAAKAADSPSTAGVGAESTNKEQNFSSPL